MLKTRVRVTSCFLWAMLTYLGFYSPNPANAETQSGVIVTVYNNYWYNNAPPLPEESGRPEVGTLVQTQVANNFDAQPLFNMYEDFIVKYEGFITLPESTEVRFYAPADDGVKFFLNDELLIDDWYDKGGGGSVSAPVLFTADESQHFVLWFYENGGGANVELMWLKDGMWETVPATAFSLGVVSTTTTEPPTTTTSQPPQTTSTTTTSTTTTTVPETTTTVPDTTTTQPVRTTTTTEPELVVALLPTTTTVPQTTTTSGPPATIQPTTTPPPQTTQAPTPTSIVIPIPETTTTVVPEITPTMTTSQAIAVVTNAEVIKELTSNQAEEVFSAVEESSLTDEQAEQIIEAVQDAPEEVRAAFESEINVFGGKFDKYVPIGSKISVAQRKAVVAASGVLFMAPTVSVSSSTSGSQSDNRKRK